ncbi:hypothetical protein FB451DRAFT_1434289 [Mycena latifolia]|nr:hypothetical protein FB451DRAFT_1434289 [Mycena latifolia]
MNITWRLSYSGVTPRRFLLGDSLLFAPLHRSHYTDSEYSRAIKHSIAEIDSRFHGHRYHKDSHPRRRFVMLVLSFLVNFYLLVLTPRYWITRKSTTSISVPGTLCIAAADFLGTFAGYQNGLALSPVEMFREGTTRIPRLRWAQATHQERRSLRLDARTNWRWKCGIFSTLLLANYTLSLNQRFVLPPVIPDYNTHEMLEIQPTSLRVVADTLNMTGGILQLILNYHARVFAGQCKAAVAAGVVLQVFRYALSMPAIIGPARVMPGVLCVEVVWDVILWVNCWQAWRYSSRIPEDDDGEDEK